MGWSTKIIIIDTTYFFIESEKPKIYCKKFVVTFFKNNFLDTVCIWNLMMEKIGSILDVT